MRAVLRRERARESSWVTAMSCLRFDVAVLVVIATIAPCDCNSHSRSFDILLHSTRQDINITNAEGYFGMFILNCPSKSYTLDMSLDLKNAGNEGLSCEFIGMPAITRQLTGVWSFALAFCLADALFHYLRKGTRMEAWLACKSVLPWVPVCAAARVIQMVLAMKTFDDNSAYGRSSPAVLLVMYDIDVSPSIALARARDAVFAGICLQPPAKVRSWQHACLYPKATSPLLTHCPCTKRNK